MFAQRFSICFQALASPRWPASCLPHILARRRRTIAPLPATTDLCFQFRLETPILREEQPCGGPPSPGGEILSGGADFPENGRAACGGRGEISGGGGSFKKKKKQAMRGSEQYDQT